MSKHIINIMDNQLNLYQKHSKKPFGYNDELKKLLTKIRKKYNSTTKNHFTIALNITQLFRDTFQKRII